MTQAELERARATALRITGGSFLLAGLPAPVLRTTAGFDGRFEARVPPGRYGLVATARAADGAERRWFLWTRVQANEVETLWLNDENLAGTECGPCIITPSRLAAAAQVDEAGTR